MISIRCSVVFPILTAIVQAQLLIDLKTLKGNNEENLIFNGTTSIYITATLDDEEWLKQMTIQSSDSGTASVYDITKRRADPKKDLMGPWIAKGRTTLTSSLDQQKMGLLTGTIYCTSEKQAVDPHLYVFDVSQEQTIQIDSGRFGDYTAVFLNSDTRGFHMQSTSFSEWKQDISLSVAIYPNLPSDQAEIEASQIFSNPMLIGKKETFFPTVNPFSVTLGAFYMRFSGNGSLVAHISPKYYDLASRQTLDITSTGFYMKSYTELERDVQFGLLQDPNFNVTSGANSIAEIPKTGNVTVNIQNENWSHNSVSFPPSNQILGWTTSFVGDSMTISSKNTVGGQFFIQYFTLKGRRLNGTSNTMTTSSESIETSTKSTGGSVVLK